MLGNDFNPTDVFVLPALQRVRWAMVVLLIRSAAFNILHMNCSRRTTLSGMYITNTTLSASKVSVITPQHQSLTDNGWLSSDNNIYAAFHFMIGIFYTKSLFSTFCPERLVAGCFCSVIISLRARSNIKTDIICGITVIRPGVLLSALGTKETVLLHTW